jgi:hypothetical protein
MSDQTKNCRPVATWRDQKDSRSHEFSLSFAASLLVLLVVWATVVMIVNPRGEFMVNDDWCFVRAFQGLFSEGRLDSTGWGPAGAPGGPSLLVHLLWARFFTYIGGFSLTTLRLSVLAAGILGSAALWALLRAANGSGRDALWGTLTLVLSPLFLSQCFTFMTDITFTALVTFALWLMFLGVRTGRTGILAAAMLVSLASVLTRQIGVVVPAAFVVTCFLHPRGGELGRGHMAAIALTLVVVPWLMYEFFLAWIGSTPITQHQVIQEVWRHVSGRGFPAYAADLYLRLVHGALPYTCIFVSPVLAMRYRWLWAHRSFRWFFWGVTSAFAVFEVLLLGGVIDPPVQGLRNVIYNAGIGPVLLKDVYLLWIPRGDALSQPLYYCLVYGAVLAMGAFAGLAFSSLSHLVRNRVHGIGVRAGSAFEGETGCSTEVAAGFIASVALVSALVYLGVIALTGFHDRYLIPACLFLIVWLCLDRSKGLGGAFSMPEILLGLAPLLLFGVFSLAATADFMELKRAQKKAHDFILYEMKANPCDGDGGMEFNGYHCYRRDFKASAGLSWWWVVKEDFLVTLGPLRGYDVVRTFPFSRYIGSEGAIHVLKPVPCLKPSPR